jgi:hypothetical protein
LSNDEWLKLNHLGLPLSAMYVANLTFPETDMVTFAILTK